jgi:lysozyme
MDLSEIKKSEGLELKAYKRKGDVWTIGYGSTYYKDNTRIKQGDVITKEQAEDLLLYKVNNEYLPQLNSVVKVELNENQKSALLSLLYNIGIGNLKKTKLLYLINQFAYY